MTIIETPSVSEIQSFLNKTERELSVVSDIESELDYDIFLEVSRRVKKQRDTIVELFEKPKNSAHQAHKDICALEKGFLNRFDALLNHVKSKLLAHKQKQDAEKAQKLKEIAAEANKKSMELIDLRTSGDEIAAVKQEKELYEALSAQQDLLEKSKEHIRKTYKCEVVDFDKLLELVNSGKISKQALMSNQKFLDAEASKLKEDFEFDGLRLVINETLIVR